MIRILLIITFALSLGGCLRATYNAHDFDAERATLPRDEAPHFKNSLEWWYFTGHLTDTLSGREYGIEYVFFHFTPRGRKDAMMVNVAITDPEAQRFYFDYQARPLGRHLRPALPISLHMKKGKVDMSLFGQEGVYYLDAQMQRHRGYGFQLQTQPGKGLLLHEGTGYAHYGELAKAGYYSYPRLQSDGFLYLNGEKVPVVGELWYDRQWNGHRLGTDRAIGWDWISIQLDDPREEIMVYLLKDYDEELRIVGGTLFSESGEAIHLAQEDIQLSEQQPWRSPRSKGQYPMTWELKIPRLGYDLQVNAILHDQELELRFLPWLPFYYWEGMAGVQGTKEGLPVSGKSYVEITNRHHLEKRLKKQQ